MRKELPLLPIAAFTKIFQAKVRYLLYVILYREVGWDSPRYSIENTSYLPLLRMFRRRSSLSLVEN